MAELINNREQRIALMTTIIRELHQGVPEDQVRAKMRDLVRVTDASEIAAMEQQLISEGMPVGEVMGMCDVHAAVTREILREAPRVRAVDDHPVSIMRAENEELTRLIQRARTLLGDVPVSGPVDAAVAAELRGLQEMLARVDQHYQRKEHLIFPILERYGVTGPSTVMWGKDDEARALVKEWGRTLAPTPVDAAATRAALGPALNAVADMITKENEILLPMAEQRFTEADWAEVRGQQGQFEVLWVDAPEPAGSGMAAEPAGPGRARGPVPLAAPIVRRSGPDAVGAAAGPGAVGSSAVGSGAGPIAEVPAGAGASPLYRAPSGALSVEQLHGILKVLPLDMTFIDADDRVAYFTEGAERVFPRPRTIVGRLVQQCHPPASVDVVERILADFRSGSQDECAFWIQRQGQFVHIRYYAVRDEAGGYLGTLEVTQDLTALRALTGERRLLEYDAPANERDAPVN